MAVLIIKNQINSVVFGEPEPPTKRSPSGVIALVWATRHSIVVKFSHRPLGGSVNFFGFLLFLFFFLAAWYAFASAAISAAGFFLSSKQRSPSQAISHHPPGAPRAFTVGENINRLRGGSLHCLIGDHSSTEVPPSGSPPTITSPVGLGGPLQQEASVISANRRELVLRSHIGSHYILLQRPQV